MSKGALPRGVSTGQMGPRLLSYVAVLSGLYHLSVRKIQRLLQDQYGTHFSTGLISEAQGRVSSMLTPTHQALHQHIKKASLVHVDETTHNRNGEQHTRWVWLLSSQDAVFQQVKYFRNKDAARSAANVPATTGLNPSGINFALPMCNVIYNKWPIILVRGLLRVSAIGWYYFSSQYFALNIDMKLVKLVK